MGNRGTGFNRPIRIKGGMADKPKRRCFGDPVNDQTLRRPGCPSGPAEIRRPGWYRAARKGCWGRIDPHASNPSAAGDPMAAQGPGSAP